jgi:hypothetical protein
VVEVVVKEVVMVADLSDGARDENSIILTWILVVIMSDGMVVAVSFTELIVMMRVVVLVVMVADDSMVLVWVVY